MPCAAGEQCRLPDRTPVAPHGHQCHGGCGGRLHGLLCGEQDEDAEFETVRIYLLCVHCLQAKGCSIFLSIFLCLTGKHQLVSRCNMCIFHGCCVVQIVGFFFAVGVLSL